MLSCWLHSQNTDWCQIFSGSCWFVPSRQGWIWPLYSRPNECLPAQHIMFGGKTSCSSTIKICSQGSKDVMTSTQSWNKMGPRQKCLVLLQSIKSRLGFLLFVFLLGMNHAFPWFPSSRSLQLAEWFWIGASALKSISKSYTEPLQNAAILFSHSPVAWNLA